MKSEIAVREPCSPEHIKWFINTGECLVTADGKEIEVWEFRHDHDETVLSSWAKHLRNHYCLDSHIDFLRNNLSRYDYLTNIKFPDKTSKLGPGIRAGDFGEILVADYLEWILGYWVPRVRWSSKKVRDESPKGCDVVGFRFFDESAGISNKDVLFVCESKTKFSKSRINRLQDAVNDSAKDERRVGESLNYIRQKFYEAEKIEEAERVGRFQDPVDSAYRQLYGASAIISDEYYDVDELISTDCTRISKTPRSRGFFPHPNRNNLFLVVIKGSDMMNLVHELYRRAADEA